MPPKKADLRACLICSILQSSNDFLTKGCPNCEDVLQMTGSADRVAECTSLMYDGMIAMIEPSQSWVARWQRIDKRKRGIYAVRVTGRPPEDVIKEIESRGGVYRPRDTDED
ncbi:transcription initiation protein spt4 [Naematelia encephala]|uniref:Transcription elongation factor SPT4 n=1 Tax=Naematelia encephala TaxID=71784 RepID=A0A1Y2BG70_9TREE|nr:transcription initiation protein spt4 [Naematelia encephala]